MSNFDTNEDEGSRRDAELESRYEREEAARRELADLLAVTVGSMANDGRTIVSEALTDCSSAGSTQRCIANIVMAAIMDDSDNDDADLGRIVREAVTDYARQVLAARVAFSKLGG
jgi:hypothetical protein